MKIEKIDENQIRCILTSDDLESRHLSIQDLAYGSDKARSLFMEMVQAAATETDFKLDGIPLMIEAVPISNNGLMLIITRVEDPEELDMRFSRFTQSVPLMEYNDDGVSKPTVNSLLNTLKRYVESQTMELADNIRCFRFNTLSDLIDGCQAVNHLFKGDSTLYKADDDTYYLFLFRDSDAESFDTLTTVLMEYGDRIMTGIGTPSYFEEHYDMMMDHNVVESLAKV